MWCFVDGGALAETVPRRLITSGAVVWVDVPTDVPLEEVHLTDDDPVGELPPAVADDAPAEPEAVAETPPEPVKVVESAKPTPKRRPSRRKA